MDYFGPLQSNVKKCKEWTNVKNGKLHSKVWLWIFTCIAVRAIHQELVEGIRRFVARRGKPDEITSDNAPQFKVAKNAIDFAWENVVKDPNVIDYVNKLRIKWSFIKLVPWVGGFYKMLISITKMTLKKHWKAVFNKHSTSNNPDRNRSWSKLKTFRIMITPMHLLLINARTGLPTMSQNKKTIQIQTKES